MSGCVVTLPRVRQTLTVTSVTAAFYPGTSWRPITPIDEVDFAQNVLSIDGPGECKPGYQVAVARTDKVSGGTAITTGSYTSATGFLQYREALSSTSASNAFVRFGTMARLQAGQSGQSRILVETDVTMDTCGAVLGAKQIEVQPFMSGVDDANTPVFTLTDWAATLGVAKLKGIIIVMNNENTSFEYALLVRTCIDRSQPGAWVNLEAAYTNPATGNSERNTGELTIPAGANFSTRSWYQVGIGVRKKSGSTGNPRCMLHAMAHSKLA